MVAQGLLAGAIAKALGSFFEINESMVESKLLHKKKITLTNLRLKPRVIRRSENYTIELHGKIKQGVFKWKWSGKGLLKGCTFILEGLRVTLKQGSSESEMNFDEVTRINSEKKKKSNKGGFKETGEDVKEGWKAKLVNNIIDQLKVKVEDFELVIEVPRNPLEEGIPWKRQIRVSGRNIELESLGRIYPKNMFRNRRVKRRDNTSAPLLQELSIESLSADVIVVDTQGNAQAYPLLHPFQYVARGKRFFGKRFSDFTSGLEVEGLDILHSERISRQSYQSLKYTGSLGAYESIKMGAENVGVYVDGEEIETSLCNEQLLNMSHSVSWEFDGSSSVPESRDEVEVENDDRVEASPEVYLVLGEEQLLALFGIVSLFTDQKIICDEEGDGFNGFRNSYMGPGGLKQLTKISPMNFGQSSRTVNKASKFDLPLPCVQVLLPNNASVRAEKCKIELKTDNSLAKFFGSGSVTIDGQPCLKEGILWVLDLKRKEIVVDPKGVSPTGHQWEWMFHHDEKESESPLEVSFDHIRLVGSGFAKILEARKSAQKHTSKPQQIQQHYSKWSINIKGQSKLSF